MPNDYSQCTAFFQYHSVLHLILTIPIINLVFIWYILYIYTYVSDINLFDIVPTPTVNVTSFNIQIVGQSVTLQCEVTTVRGITSRVDIVWSSDGIELERMNNVSLTTMNSSLVYTDYYTISQLSTTDDDRVIQCEGLINANTPVMASDSITLDVTGECTYCSNSA